MTFMCAINYIEHCLAVLLNWNNENYLTAEHGEIYILFNIWQKATLQRLVKQMLPKLICQSSITSSQCVLITDFIQSPSSPDITLFFGCLSKTVSSLLPCPSSFLITHRCCSAHIHTVLLMHNIELGFGPI